MVEQQRYGLAFKFAKRTKHILHDALNQKCAQIEAAFAEHLVTNINFFKDGKCGVIIFNNPAIAFDISVALQEAAWPVALQHALCTAPPAGAASQDSSIQEKALKILLKMGRHDVFKAKFSSKAGHESAMANTIADLHRTIVLNFTRTRLDAVTSYRKHRRQADVAAELNISQQAVSQMMLGARWKQLKSAEAIMREWLEEPKRSVLWPIQAQG